MAELINEPARETRVFGERRTKSRLEGNRRWWRLFRDCAAVPAHRLPTKEIGNLHRV
jgi:hypothetical protein